MIRTFQLFTIACICSVVGATTLRAQAGRPLRCDPVAKRICSASECRSAPATIWVLLFSDSYMRCDAKGCDKYEAHTTQSGEFVTVEVPGRPLFARIGPGGSFMEVAAFGTDALITHGTCQLYR